nr:unnamed protein product [Callosobruchus analis]
MVSDSRSVHDDPQQQSLPLVRKDRILKFPTPSYCLTLQPPKLNEEVRSIIATQTQKNDRYMIHLQEQMGASVSAIGSILNLKLLDPQQAAQLLASSFHAFSVKRRFDIQPFLSQESRDASYKCPPTFDIIGPTGFKFQVPFYKTKKKRSPSPIFERRLKMDHRKDHQKNREIRIIAKHKSSGNGEPRNRDDWLFIARSHNECLCFVAIAKDLLENVGFIINTKKISIRPGKEIEFLGF